MLIYNSSILFKKFDLFLILLVSFLNIANSAFYGDYNFTFLFASLRLIWPIFIFRLFITSKSLNNLNLRIIDYLFLFACFFSVINFIPIFYDFLDMYKGRTSDGILLYQFFRISGFLIYPSSFCLILILILHIKLKSKRLDKIKKYLIPIMILISSSRAGIFFMLLYYVMFKTKQSLKFFFFGLPPAIILITYYFADEFTSNFEYLILTFNSLLNGEVDGSTKFRLGEIGNAYEVIIGNSLPIFGDYSKIDFPFIEGLYSYYIINYGFIGLLLLIIMTCYFFNQLSVFITKREMYFLILLFTIWGFSSDIFNHSKGVFFTYFIIVNFWIKSKKTIPDG